MRRDAGYLFKRSQGHVIETLRRVENFHNHFSGLRLGSAFEKHAVNNETGRMEIRTGSLLFKCNLKLTLLVGMK